jgi:UPF0716 protein FxsA
MLPALVVLFVVVPLVELALILQVGREIGPWWTVGLLVANSVIGSVILRAQGRLAWRRFTDAMRAGHPPAREVLDGALIIGGGALLLTPGFLTDIIGLLLLLPPSRTAIRRLLTRRLTHRMLTGMARPQRTPTSHAEDYEGSASETRHSGPGNDRLP